MKPNKQDRISKYLSMLNMGMLFDELSDSYLENAGVIDVLKGVPVPISIDESGNMTTLSIALNMARIVGGTDSYPYAKQYLEYIDRITSGNALKFLVSEGAKAADSEKYEEACMFFRAALYMDPKSCDALYLYGRACKGAYETEEKDEEYVGSFKAESLEVFELLTMLHPDYAMGYYFLGYAYLNLGLYTKARLTWNTFMELSIKLLNDSSAPNEELEKELREQREEIQQRLDALEEPVKIEKACNLISGGDYSAGIEILSKYKTGRYEKWWPLWYYLAVAYASLGDAEEAIAAYKKTLTLTPSNIDVMEELVCVYEAIGDEVNADKYRKKIEIVKSNIEQEAIDSEIE